MITEQEPGRLTARFLRRPGLNPSTLQRLKARYGGLDVWEAWRPRLLEEEKSKLKRLLAASMPDNPILMDLLGDA